MATPIQNEFFVIPNHFVKFVKGNKNKFSIITYNLALQEGIVSTRQVTLKDTGPELLPVLTCLIHKDMQLYRIFWKY